MYSIPGAGPEPISIQASSVIVFAALARVRAGFPSPAADFAVERIDLSRELVHHPEATYMLRVEGFSMVRAGIDDGDTLVVDRAITAVDRDIVVAVVDGEFTVKRLSRIGRQIKLLAENPEFADITPEEGQEIVIWGVVTSCIKRFRN